MSTTRRLQLQQQQQGAETLLMRRIGVQKTYSRLLSLPVMAAVN